MDQEIEPYFIETILCYQGKLPFIDFHLERIRLISEKYCLEATENIEQILLISSTKYQYGKIRLKWNETTMIIEQEKFDKSQFFYIQPIDVGICDTYQKQKSNTSNFKNNTDIDYNYLSSYCEKNNINQCLIENDKYEIIESNISNIFILKDDHIITPPLSSGCVDGVFRKVLSSHFDISEENIILQDLIDSDGVFLTNALRGIQIVGRIDNLSISTTKSIEIQKSIFDTIEHKYL